jgi:peptidoglycan/LPS O-acetylase OafA/YrhL
MFAALAVLVLLAWWYAAVSKSFDTWFPFPSTARWSLGVFACVLILAGLGMNPGDCWTDWDGISNPTVCD